MLAKMLSVGHYYFDGLIAWLASQGCGSGSLSAWIRITVIFFAWQNLSLKVGSRSLSHYQLDADFYW